MPSGRHQDSLHREVFYILYIVLIYSSFISGLNDTSFLQIFHVDAPREGI